MEAGESTIALDAVDKEGRKRSVTLRAIPIGRSKLFKQESSGGTASNVDEKDVFQDCNAIGQQIIEPPYSLLKLATLKDQSTELRQCIQAIVTNTTGFGWQLRERQMKDGVRESLVEHIEEEKARLLMMMETVHPTESFDTIRKNAKDDQHSCGNGYIELIDGSNGDLVGMSHIPGYAVRLAKRDTEPVKVMVPRVDPTTDYSVTQVAMWHRFRRFAMSMMNGESLLWFKEAGDPRYLDKYTGKYSNTMPVDKRATALMHFRIYHPTTPYGVPHYVGNLFSIYGSRAAEETNYNTLTSNGIPSMFVIIENGALTEGSIARLKEWTEEQVQGAMNFSKFLLLEGDTTEGGIQSPNSFKIRIEPLAGYQKTDELFQKYDANNRDKIRYSFRLPPVFVGKTEDYTRATADASKAVADEQVFAPERADDDFLFNRHVLSRWGARFHTLKTNHPNVTDDSELIRLMGIAEKSGGMTPRRADRIVRGVFGDDIGPMPQGVPLDTPFSITFAAAQQGMNGSATGNGVAEPKVAARHVIDGLLDLRRRVEKELDDRFFLHNDVDNKG